jgi:hypothetical protein
MTYAVTYDVPIDKDFYAKIADGLGPERPDGLLVHVAHALPEGGLRYVDVWRSEADADRFAEERLHPVVHPLLEAELGFTPPEPERTPLDVVHVWSDAVDVR